MNEIYVKRSAGKMKEMQWLLLLPYEREAGVCVCLVVKYVKNIGTHSVRLRRTNAQKEKKKRTNIYVGLFSRSSCQSDYMYVSDFGLSPFLRNWTTKNITLVWHWLKHVYDEGKSSFIERCFDGEGGRLLLYLALAQLYNGMYYTLSELGCVVECENRFVFR